MDLQLPEEGELQKGGQKVQTSRYKISKYKDIMLPDDCCWHCSMIHRKVKGVNPKRKVYSFLLYFLFIVSTSEDGC